MSCICLYSEWISLDSYSGSLNSGETDSLTVNIDTSGMNFGTYNCNVIVTDLNRQVSIIPVVLKIIPIFLPAPINIEVIITDGNSYLSWDPVPGSEGYKIYRSADPYNGFIEIGTTSNTSYIDHVTGEKFFYTITAYYTETRVNNLESDMKQ